MLGYNIFRKKSTDKPISSSSLTSLNKEPVQMNDVTVVLQAGYLLLDERLGDGSYSKVKLAFSKKRKRNVAVKIVNRQLAPDDFLQHFLPRELEIIGNIKHPNICTFYEVLDTGKKVFIFMEYSANGDLLEYIKKHKCVVEKLAKQMFSQIVSALQYLHSEGILHRDLKCENILLNDKLQPLLTDFGFAKRSEDMSELSETYCGSSAYAPIEVLQGIPYDSRSAEVWSLGCILYVVTTGTMPYNDLHKKEQIHQMKRELSFNNSKQYICKTLRLLLTQMLNMNAKSRITLLQVQNADWLALN